MIESLDSGNRPEVEREWKTRYLAQLLELANVFCPERNKEFLAALEVQRRLHATIDHFIQAIEDSRRGFETPPDFNPIVAERHLSDLYALALVDGVVSEIETNIIESFIQTQQIPPHVVEQVKSNAKHRAHQLIAEAVDRCGF